MNWFSRLDRVLGVCMCLVLMVIGSGVAPSTVPAPELRSAVDSLPTIELPDRSNLILGKVVRILDGDTVLIKVDGSNRRYQLLGADAPEFVHTDRTPDPYSIKARRFITQLLLGESVYIQPDPDGDLKRSSQWGGYLFRAPDMLFVNLELVRQGYAKHTIGHDSLYEEAFAFYAQRAKELQRGIWNPDGALDDATPVVISDEVDEPSTNTPITGDSNQAAKPTDHGFDGDEIVYITKYGTKYHTKDCPHLTDTMHAVKRKDLDDSFEACKTCKPDEPQKPD